MGHLQLQLASLDTYKVIQRCKEGCHLETQLDHLTQLLFLNTSSNSFVLIRAAVISAFICISPGGDIGDLLYGVTPTLNIL